MAPELFTERACNPVSTLLRWIHFRDTRNQGTDAMIRSNPYNLGRFYQQGQAAANAEKVKEPRGMTPTQAGHFWAGFYSVKAPNGSLPARDGIGPDQF